MENFECNDIEDLVFNHSFRSWILAKRSPETQFWKNWEKRNQDKTEIINCAKAIIYALQIDFDTLSDEQVNEEISKVIEKFEH